MSSLIADIFVTTKGRGDLFKRSIKSLVECTPSDQYRLTVIDDTGELVPCSEDILYNLGVQPHTYIKHAENMGLGPSINQALAHIQALNEWYADKQAGDPARVAEFICYLQDDLLYTRDWLSKLAQMHVLQTTFLNRQGGLGFSSGLECVEHREGLRDVGGGMLLKRYIRAACMFARRTYWMSMFPIPPLDPETGRLRAKPSDGVGSGVDWWFMRNAQNSVERTGRTCLVIPGLVQHLGYDRSTWLDRELPESESDRETIRKA